jgi:hypothetical protein
MKTTKNITFFMPHTKANNYESAYELAKKAVIYQLGWPITERRIESLTYINNKKHVTAKVGDAGEYQHQYEAVAILESEKYIIVTKTIGGQPGPTILVDPNDVTKIEDFTGYESARPQKMGTTSVQE